MARNRRDAPNVGRMRLTTRTLYVPSAPRFLARNTSAMPPAPSLRITSNGARSRVGAGGVLFDMVGLARLLRPPQWSRPTDRRDGARADCGMNRARVPLIGSHLHGRRP